MTIRRKQHIFPASYAAKNSASVDEPAVSDCVLDFQTMAPPQKVNIIPVVDRRQRKSFACAASQNPSSIGQLISTSLANPLSSGIEYHADGKNQDEQVAWYGENEFPS